MTFYNTYKNESDFVFFFLKYFTSELILNQHCTWGIEVKQVWLMKHLLWRTKLPFKFKDKIENESANSEMKHRREEHRKFPFLKLYGFFICSRHYKHSRNLNVFENAQSFHFPFLSY